MTNKQVQWHEELKQLSIDVYNPDEQKLAKNGYKILFTDSDKRNGFNAMVVKKDNNVVIVYRGTDDFADLNNDIKMGALKKLPSQTENAIDLYNQMKSYCKNNNLNLTVTGHSLGGSLAQIVGAKTGANAVTFDAYGTKDLFKNNELLHSENITNYCMDNDYTIARFNAHNYIGKCYKVPSTKSGIRHSIEYMGQIQQRKEVSASDLSSMLTVKREVDKIKGRASDIRIDINSKIQNGYDEIKKYSKSFNEASKLYTSSTNKCTGSYSVSGYERKDGTKVQSYIRECFKHGNP